MGEFLSRFRKSHDTPPRKDSSSAFEQQHTEILGKYYKPEIFLGTQNLRDVEVIPMAGELRNGNLWHMIESISNLDQETPTDSIEFLFVVNNRTSDKGGDKYIEENQRTLRILHIYENQLLYSHSPEGNLVDARNSLRQQLLDEGVNSNNADLLEECLRRSVRLHGIDASSSGREIVFAPLNYDFQYAPGHARNIGGHIAYERLGIKDEAIIDFKDSDCLYPTDYFINLQRQVNGRKEALFFGVDVSFAFLPDVDESYMTTAEERFRTIDYYANQVLTGGNTSILSYLHHDWTHYRMTFDPKDYKEGPQLAISPQVFRDIEGYPTAGYKGEDWQAVYSTLHTSPDVRFFTGQLPQIRTVPGKFDSASILDWKRLSTSTSFETMISSDREYFLSTVAQIYRAYQSDPNFQQELQQQLRVESERRQQSVSLLNEVFHYYLSTPLSDSSSRVEALLGENRFVRRFVQDVVDMSGASSPAEAMTWVEDRFPILFSAPPIQVDYQRLLVNGNYSSLNPRDFVHIPRAAFLLEARRRERK